MENNIIKNLKNKLESCCESIREYNSFVCEMENFFDYNSDLDLKIKSLYNEKWFELETLNACALLEWEESKYADNFNTVWNNKFKNDAKKLTNELVDFIIIHG